MGILNNKEKAKEMFKFFFGIKAYELFLNIYHCCNPVLIGRYFYRCYNHRKRKSIVVLGGSHVNFFGGNEYITWKPLIFFWNSGAVNISKTIYRQIDAIHLGPALAYNMNKYGTTVKAREKVDLLRKNFFMQTDTIICSFGEIDLRVHVIKNAQKKNKDHRDITQNILNNYMEFLIDLKKGGYNVICWGPIASQKDNWVLNPLLPRSGTEQERNRATEYFNKQLEKLCKDNNIKFATIFPHLITSEYITKEEYISDGCHLSQKAWVYAERELRKHGIILSSNI